MIHNGYGIQMVEGRSYYLLSRNGESVDHTRYTLVELLGEDLAKVKTKDDFVIKVRIDELSSHSPDTPKPRQKMGPKPKALVEVPEEDLTKNYTDICDALREFGRTIPYFSPSNNDRELFTALDVVRFVHFLDARRKDNLPNPKDCKHVNTVEIADVIECLDCGGRRQATKS